MQLWQEENGGFPCALVILDALAQLRKKDEG